MTDILSRLMPSQRKEFDALIAASKWIAAVQLLRNLNTLRSYYVSLPDAVDVVNGYREARDAKIGKGDS